MSIVKIQYKEVQSNIWYSEYLIYINGRYQGWVYEYGETDRTFNVYCPKLSITPLDNNDHFKTLREAKKYIKQKAELYFMGLEINDN